MKAVLLSVQPKWLAKILNGEKTIEIRKSLPVGFVGWVYLYCTKAKPNLFELEWNDEHQGFWLEKEMCLDSYHAVKNVCNGKVVARFWLDEVEDLDINQLAHWYLIPERLESSCLSQEEVEKYQGNPFNLLYAWNIKKLEVLDKPKELIEFYNYKFYHSEFDLSKLKPGEIINAVKFDEMARVTRTPQSWMYVEVAE